MLVRLDAASHAGLAAALLTTRADLMARRAGRAECCADPAGYRSSAA
ncbi:MAG: hypothetical protein JWN22_1424 [Nocardioides sp.]|jgi:hypothetical protein|nr:hypothetical protein [Nocardioides sp.]